MPTAITTGLDYYIGERKEDWGTPKALFAMLDAEFHFTVDVCASPHNAKCARYYTEEIDSFTQEWRGVCWMNPPYGRDIERWMQKAYESSLSGATVVCLVFSRTDTKWWHRWAMKADEIRFIKGRVKFEGGANGGAPFPSAVVIFRPERSGEYPKLRSA
jgi:phage N-6-adenine-methyltransferase